MAQLTAACLDAAPFPLPTEAPAPRPAPNVVAQVFLDEWLDVGSGARCRVEHAEQVLTEPLSEATGMRVLPDLHALSLSVVCKDRSDAYLPLDHALPRDALWFLRDEDGLPRAPSLRTKLNLSTPQPLVFELSRRQTALPATRSFDLETGHALFSSHGDKLFKLSLESAGEQRQVLLRHRASDAALDAWLSALVAAFSGERTGPLPLPEKDLKQLRELYRSLRERFLPTRLTLDDLRFTEEQALRVTLTLDRPRAHDAPSPVATLRFLLPGNSARYFEDARLIDVSDGRKTVACQEASSALRARAPDLQPQGAEESCNLLGLALPVRCDKLPDDLKRDAIALRTRCVPELEHIARITANTLNVPADFQVTLRRGRKSTGFDHSPRFVLSLFGNGAAVFHGRSFVNGIGRSDGRTSQRLLQRLMAQLKELGWFERRGGEWSSTGCSTDNPRGDVLTARAHGKERMVLDRDGCRGPFSAGELSSLSSLIELVGGVSGWIEPERELDRSQVSEWIVNAD